MNEIYVAQEVVKRREFDDYAFAHDLIGCKTRENYYIKEEVVLVIGNSNFCFCYLDGNKKCNLLSISMIENMCNLDDVFSCDGCEKSSLLNGGDCEKTVDTVQEVIGITNVVRIGEFTKCDDISSSIKFIEEYNEKVKNKYIMVNRKNKMLCKTKK